MSDPLNTNAPLDSSSAQTTVPRLAVGQYVRYKCTEAKVDQTEKGKVLKLTLTQQEPAKTVEGQTLNPGEFGSTFWVNIQLYSKPDSKRPTWFIEKIAGYQDALLGTGIQGNPKGKPVRPNIFAPGATLQNADLDMGQVQALVGNDLIAKIGESTNPQTSEVRMEFTTVHFPADLGK